MLQQSSGRVRRFRTANPPTRAARWAGLRVPTTGRCFAIVAGSFVAALVVATVICPVMDTAASSQDDRSATPHPHRPAVIRIGLSQPSSSPTCGAKRHRRRDLAVHDSSRTEGVEWRGSDDVESEDPCPLRQPDQRGDQGASTNQQDHLGFLDLVKANLRVHGSRDRRKSLEPTRPSMAFSAKTMTRRRV